MKWDETTHPTIFCLQLCDELSVFDDILSSSVLAPKYLLSFGARFFISKAVFSPKTTLFFELFSLFPMLWVGTVHFLLIVTLDSSVVLKPKQDF